MTIEDALATALDIEIEALCPIGAHQEAQIGIGERSVAEPFCIVPHEIETGPVETQRAGAVGENLGGNI